MARVLAPVLVLCGWLVAPCAADPAAERALESEFQERVRPLLKRYCAQCHAGDVTEAEIDLGKFTTVAEARGDIEVWLKTRRILASGEMPPKEARQPSDNDLQLLRRWLRQFLTREAAATAGDPGPVLLRRLNNDQYNYTIRDLTGVDALNPTREFPVDGAAGEGFINTGSAQSMSPSYLSKYLNAAKEVAEHVVLLPDGIRFSPATTRRDQVDELLARIQAFYRQFTVDGGGSAVNLQGIKFDTNQGGLLPVKRYLQTLLDQRQALQRGGRTLAEVAAEQSLNARYLAALWETLNAPPTGRSLFLDRLREQWNQATPGDAAKLAHQIAAVQQRLWKFNSVGQLAGGGKQKVWMEPVAPLLTRRELRLPIASAETDEIVFYLTASDLGDGNDGDYVVWERPRFEFKPDAAGDTHPPLLLRDLDGLAERVHQLQNAELPRTARYLQAVQQLGSAPQDLETLARDEELNARLLKRWVELLKLARGERVIRGHFTQKLERAQGYADVNGWGTPQTPNVLANRSREAIRFLTLTVPGRGVVVHPSPAQDALVVWRSPLAGRLKLKGRVADADAQCGNGAAWRVELTTAAGTRVLDRGVFDNGQQQEFGPADDLTVRPGDLVTVAVSARDQNHACDTTHVELRLAELAGERRQWDLAGDVVDRILEANPLADTHGNPAVWHFCGSSTTQPAGPAIPPDSALARWRASVAAETTPANAAADASRRLAAEVQRVLATSDLAGLSQPDRQLRELLRTPRGPLRWAVAAAGLPAPESSAAVAPGPFGRDPRGSRIDAASLCLQAPGVWPIRVPAALVDGSEFITTASLRAAAPEATRQAPNEAARGGSVQAQLRASRPPAEEPPFSLDQPLLVATDSDGERRVRAAISEFQQLFPPALCYARIVPVDEVVTMTLYFREDQHLQRLMLSDAQRRELDRLWDELLFVAEEPLALTVAFEQIYEFATQDRPDLVKAFGPMREPINARAEAFRERLRKTEPTHVDAILEFAARAWRRPLREGERAELRNLYGKLRAADLTHRQAIKLTLARILTSPAFLYLLERPAAGAAAAPVTDLELASRLSYFLWSSLPDQQLRQLAEAGRLQTDQALGEQARRMLQDPRTRRLAVQFACQWLHLRNFDQNDDKNESRFPEFAELRGPMYEEAVRFFEALFRDNGSILDVLNADYTFVNAPLARHYGLKEVAGPQWQRVAGIRPRGGILGMAALLASQSGASRTSPILRGNWVYETLLGERLPRPPANVPQLPETVPQGLTARQLIEQHSAVEGCRRCHAKIDPLGFALEQYDALGRERPARVDTATRLEDGTTLDGIDGLRAYLSGPRRDAVVRQFCRKLLGFSLGREVQLSDEILLDSMQRQLAAGDYRFHVAVEAIVTSDQFRRIRGASFGTRPQAGPAPPRQPSGDSR